MALTDFLRKTKKRIFDGITMDAGAGIQKGYSSLGRMARSIRDEIADSPVGDYFRPTERVRTRDFIREVPGATASVGKTMFGGTLNVAKNVPKIFGEGLAYGLDKNIREQYKKGNTEILPTITKVSPTKMLGDTGKSLLEVGTLGRGPKLGVMKKAIPRIGIGTAGGYAYDVADRAAEKGRLEKKDFTPGMNTLASGVLSAVSRPTAEMAQEAIKDAKVAVQDIKRLPRSARTTIIPAAKEKISRTIHDANKHMGTFREGPDGKLKKVDGFNWQHKEGEFSYPEERIVEPWNPKSGLINGILKPGMRIEAVSGKIAEKNAKAKEVVDDQINRLKNGVKDAAEGFVMPRDVKGKTLSPEEQSVEETIKNFRLPEGFVENLGPAGELKAVGAGATKLSKAVMPNEIERIQRAVDSGTLVGRKAYAKLMQWKENVRNGEKIKAATTKAKAVLTGDPVEDFKRSLDETTAPFETVKKGFNRFQEEAFQKKQEIRQELHDLINAPRILKVMGYTKKAAEKLGKKEQDIIARLGQLGYRRGDPILDDPYSDMVKRVLRFQVPKETLKNYYTRKRELDTNFLEGVDAGDLQDVSAIKSGSVDPTRLFERTFGRQYGRIKERLLDPFNAAKGEYIDEMKHMEASLEDAIVKGLGIKKGSNLSALVQRYGEGKISLDDLKAKYPNHWERVVKADQWFRNMYDTMLEETNRLREFYFPTHPLHPESSKVIPKRQNYYRHFQEMQDGFKGLLNIFDTPASIDPELAVSSQYTKPLTKWLSFAQRRKGDKTTEDAVGGFLDYIRANAYAKHIDPFIQQFRGVDKELAAEARKTGAFFDDSRIGLAEELSRKVNPIVQIAEATDPNVIKNLLLEKGLQERDAIRFTKNLLGKSEEEVGKYLEKNLSEEGLRQFIPTALAEGSENKLNNFLKFLDEHANNLAGKTNPFDRPVMNFGIGRQYLRALDWINSKVKLNTIVGNASSSVAQFFAIPSGAAEAGPKYAAKGAGRTLLDVFDSNSPSSQSNFLKERFYPGQGRFDPGIFARSRDFLVWITAVGDRVGATFTWNAARLKALGRGLSEEQAGLYADDITERIVGNRGIGGKSILQNSKTVQFFAPFQLELANQWSVFRDWAKQDPKKLALASKFIQYSAYVWLLNRVAKELRGSDVAFDPLEAMIDAYDTYQEADNKRSGLVRGVGRIAGEVLSNIPYIGEPLAANAYDEYGGGFLGGALEKLTGEKISREELFGDKDPTRFGSGVLASRSFSDPVFSLLMPIGGRQLKNTIKGAGDLMRGYAETGSDRVMTPVEGTWPNIAKGLIFGRGGIDEVQDYYENDQSPLSKDQSEKFRLGVPGYYESVMASRGADKEKEAITKALDKGKAIERSGDLQGGVFQLEDGSFWVPTLRADTKTFKTQEDATFAIQKEEFEDSTDSFQDLGEYVLRKREDGSVYSQRKDAFTVSLLTAKMTGAKRRESYEQWVESANQQYQLLQKLIQDPTVDDLERAEYENKMMLLEDDFSKYESYGGNFKKGSGGSGKKIPEKFRSPLVDPELIRIENSIASPSRASLSVGVPMRFIKPRMVKSRKVKSRKVNL